MTACTEDVLHMTPAYEVVACMQHRVENVSKAFKHCYLLALAQQNKATVKAACRFDTLALCDCFEYKLLA